MSISNLSTRIRILVILAVFSAFYSGLQVFSQSPKEVPRFAHSQDGLITVNKLGDPIDFNEITLEVFDGDYTPLVTFTFSSASLEEFFVESLFDMADHVFIRLVCNENPKNGVSTLDLIRIQKHLLGIQPFTDYCQLIAADANNSQTVSAVDLIELRKLILGIYDELPNKKSWEFVDDLDGCPEIGSMLYPDGDKDLQEYILSNTFIGIKIGDLNNSVMGGIAPRGEQLFSVATQDRYIKAGETVSITFQPLQAVSLLGLQFTLEFNGLEVTRLESASLPDIQEYSAQWEDVLTLAWYSHEGIQMDLSSDLISIKCMAQNSGRLSQMIALTSEKTEQLAYDGDENQLSVELVFKQEQTEANFLGHTFSPNPIANESTLNFFLNKDGPVKLEFFTPEGQLLQSLQEDFAKGNHSWKVDIPGRTGMIWYTIQTGSQFAAGRLVKF